MNKIIICDDREADRKKYSRLINKFAARQNLEIEIVMFESGKALLFEMEGNRQDVDIIFLDIHMPGIDGMEVAKKLREFNYRGEIIFLTVSQDHILDAFDVGAFHYIIKDQCTMRRFEEILLNGIEKAREREKEYICFTGGGESINILLASIRYFEVTNRIITVHYEEDKAFGFYSTMGKLETRLRGYGFVRVHRSFLVSIAHIEVLLYGKVKLRGGVEVPVGRSYYQEVKNTLKERSGLQ